MVYIYLQIYHSKKKLIHVGTYIYIYTYIYINPIDPMGNSIKRMKLPFTALKESIVFQAKNGLSGELLNHPRIFRYLKMEGF